MTKFLHKYTFVLFLVATVAVIRFSEDRGALIILLSTVVLWTITVNIAIHRISKGHGEWWGTGSLMFSLVLGLVLVVGGLNFNPAGTLFICFWFGLVMGGYIFMERSFLPTENDDYKGPRIFLKFVYGFFLFSALIYTLGQRNEIVWQFQKFFPSLPI